MISKIIMVLFMQEHSSNQIEFIIEKNEEYLNQIHELKTIIEKNELEINNLQSQMDKSKIKINEHEEYTVDVLISKLLWNREERKKYKELYEIEKNRNKEIESIDDVVVELNDKEMYSVRALKSKLLWNRKELKKYKKLYMECIQFKNHY